MYLVISKCVTAVKVSNFSGHYLRNRSTLYIVVLGYIGIVQHKEHSPEVWHIPPGTPRKPCMHKPDCAELVSELPLLPNISAVKRFHTNRERCEVLTGYLPLGRRTGGDRANT